jgi:hypothetical protein
MLRDRRLYTHDFRKQDHGVTEIAMIVFRAGEDPALARAICIAMRDNAGDNYVSDREFSGVAALIMEHYPLIVYEEIVEKSTNEHLLERFFGELADDDEDKVIEPEKGVAILLDWVAQDAQARVLKVANLVRYMVKDEASGELRWSALALALVRLAPDPATVLRAFEQRFFTGAGWGPFSLRFVRRRPLVAAMLVDDDPRVRAWAREAGPRLEDSIRRWDDRDRDRDSRFE